MAVPKRKTTPSRRNKRRAHDALSAANFVENQTTGEYSLPHHISPDGYYKGRQVIIPRDEDDSEGEE
jgi:large subunit ribosomal protein L32